MLSLHLCNEMHISAVSNIHFHVNLICINWKQDVFGFYFSVLRFLILMHFSSCLMLFEWL